VYVLGRNRTGEAGRGPVADLGHYRAVDGSDAAPVGLDVDGPHAACVVGKRGAGKSHTLGVLAEGLALEPGVRPLVCDQMGAFEGLSAAGFDVVEPRVRAAALPPEAWPDLLGLDPTEGPGALVWRAAAERETLAAMRWFAEGSDAPDATRLAAANHLRLAEAWDVFDAEADHRFDGPTVVSLAGLDDAPASAVVRAVAARAYRRSVGSTGPLPWLLVDEAHVHFEGVARPALERLLTRGRAPGVSLVCATQRPTALPEVALSPADLVRAHRLTAAADREALLAGRPGNGERESLEGRWPTAPGEALVFDDATARVHAVRVRERRTDHGGASPRARDASASGDEPTRTGPSTRTETT
jgi:hypothetical protein